MTAAAIRSREQALAGALAFAMHVLFLVLLVFSVSWQQKQIDTTVVVDLWRDLPPMPQPKVDVPKPPPPVVRPEPPPAPKVEVKPPPPKPAPEPAPKPDIALKEKLEKERKLKAQQALEAKKLAAEKARVAELEKKKRAEAEALKMQQALEAEKKRVAAEQQKAQEALAAKQAAAQARIMDAYMRGLRESIHRNVVVPPNILGNPEARFQVIQIPGGEILTVTLKRSSGFPVYDDAVERAIRKASPLPSPPPGVEFSAVRELNLVFRPKE